MADLSMTARATPAVSIASARDMRVGQCDRCGAPAYVQVVLGSGRDLLLCGHHAPQHEKALTYSGALLRDQTYLLMASR